MSKEDHPIYQLYVGQTAVPVSEAVYRAYHQENERAKYLERQAQAHEVSYQAFVTPECAAEDFLDRLSGGSAPEIVRAAFSERLTQALSILEPEMQEIVWQLACKEKTMQQLADEWNVGLGTIHRRYHKACERLRILLQREGVSA